MPSASASQSSSGNHLVPTGRSAQRLHDSAEDVVQTAPFDALAPPAVSVESDELPRWRTRVSSGSRSWLCRVERIDDAHFRPVSERCFALLER